VLLAAQDLKSGFRHLAKHPGFTAAVTATLALGIAVNTAVFSLVNAILLEPLPYKDPDHVVMVSEVDPRGRFEAVSAADFVDWREANHVFNQTAALSFGGGGTLTGTGEPERILGVYVSREFFPLLGVAPLVGRSFSAADDDSTVILSYGVWQRRFAGDPDITGKKITLSDATCTVIGVLPREFNFLNRRIELWRPLRFSAGQLGNRGYRFLTVIARLRPGVSVAQAGQELSLLARRIDKTRDARVRSLGEELVEDIRPTLVMLFGAVTFVLLIAVVNIANLLLARAASREKEFAVRAVLGASRWRIVRQLLTESLLLAAIGCAAGIVMATWGVKLLLVAVPNEYQSAIVGADRIGIHGVVLAFSAIISALTAILFGLSPALLVSARNVQASLKTGRAEAQTRAGHRLQGMLVVSEVALTVVLVIGAALLIQSFARLQNVNLGYEADQILAMRVFLSDARYPEPAQQVSFFDRVLHRIESLPGVEAASVVNYGPMDVTARPFLILDRPAPRRGDEPRADYFVTAPHYFRTMGIPILEGRDFTAADSQSSPGAAIISRAAAREYWPGEDPIGRRISAGDSAPLEIVGVAGDTRPDPARDPSPAVYRPYSQASTGSELVIRCSVAPTNLARAVLHEVRAVDKDQPVMWIGTMREFADGVVWQRRLCMLLLTIFGGLALLLAAVGVYGVMSYQVARRTREIGVRVALGAQTADVLRMVLGHAFKLAACGLAIGLGAAVPLTRFIQNQLYGVGRLDGRTLIGVSLFLTLVVLLASGVPARSAIRQDPADALRAE
jgi:putative ABC transport system permease protein